MYGVFVTREEVLDDDGDWTFMATGISIGMVQPDWNYEFTGTEEECLRYAKEEYPYLHSRPSAVDGRD